MKVVMANGCFDGLHWGHICHLQQAREMGDTLIVALTRDEAVNKGPGRPRFTQRQRMEALRELRCVDAVIVVDSALRGLAAVYPHVFVKGPDYSLETMQWGDRAFCEDNSIEMRFTTGPKFSSREIFPSELRRG